MRRLGTAVMATVRALWRPRTLALFAAIVAVSVGLSASGGAATVLLVALAVVTMLKALTGRISPEAIFPADLLERSRAFQFGVLEGGLIDGVLEG